MILATLISTSSEKPVIIIIEYTVFQIRTYRVLPVLA
jgi:hypothetical protein